MYNEIVTEHFTHPRGVGVIDDADLIGMSGVEGQGYWLRLYLKLDGDRIADAKYQTYGCPSVIASGSMLIEMIIGIKLIDTASITHEVIEAEIGPLPLGKEHGPRLAADALSKALASSKQTGWSQQE